MRTWLSTLVLVATLPSCGNEPSIVPSEAEDVGSVSAAVGTPFPTGSRISHYLMGQNDWWKALPDTIWPVVDASGVRVVRIGGNDQNETPMSDNDLLAQVAKIQGIGAVPMIQVPDRGTDPAAAAAAMVRLVNVDNQRGIKFWCIGNEFDGRYEVGEEALLTAEVADTYTTIAPAMRDVDATIKIFGPGMASYNENIYQALLGGGPDDISGLDTLGRPYIDFVDFHRYPFGNNDDPNYSYDRTAVLSELHTGFPGKVDDLLLKIQDANDRPDHRDGQPLGWALTEFNITWWNLAANTATDVGVCSFLNGQFFAEYLKVGMERGAKTMATWSIRESGGDCDAQDLGFLGGTSDTNPIRRSSYYHMQMISDYLLTNVEGYLESSSSVSLMRPIATSRKNGQWLAVMILNEDLGAHTYAVSMDGGVTTGVGDTQISVEADHANAYADSMPGESTVVLVFDGNAALRKKVSYGLADLQVDAAPTVVNFP